MTKNEGFMIFWSWYFQQSLPCHLQPRHHTLDLDDASEKMEKVNMYISKCIFNVDESLYVINMTEIIGM